MVLIHTLTLCFVQQSHCFQGCSYFSMPPPPLVPLLVKVLPQVLVLVVLSLELLGFLVRERILLLLLVLRAEFVRVALWLVVGGRLYLAPPNTNIFATFAVVRKMPLIFFRGCLVVLPAPCSFLLRASHRAQVVVASTTLSTCLTARCISYLCLKESDSKILSGLVSFTGTIRGSVIV